jgi:hypothetical protein
MPEDCGDFRDGRTQRRRSSPRGPGCDPASRGFRGVPVRLDQRGASFETAASRPPQDQVFLSAITVLPHAEKRSDKSASRSTRDAGAGHTRTPPMPNALYYGDNLDVLRDSISSESVDLVYLDPPFNSQASYNVLFKGP